MVSITLNTIGKKFGREWVFRHLSHEIACGDKLVILGGNGSGKSTLLQIVSGFVTPAEGEVIYTKDKQAVGPELVKNLISFASPYLQLTEELTMRELILHCEQFKPFLNSITAADVPLILELEKASEKHIRHFSSGMKQRLKLGLAILSDTPVLLLDEPVSNLDAAAIKWYHNMIHTYTKERSVVVCSNAIGDEYSFCNKTLNVMAFKPQR